MKALRELYVYITDSVDWTCHVHIREAENVHEMMKNLVTAYKQSDSEVLGELEKEYNKLRKPPRRQDLNIWLDQWNNLYERANKGKYTKYTGLSALLDFVNAVKSVNPFFAQITYQELMQKD